MKIRFYDCACDKKLKFAVIAAQYEGKWVLCRHCERDTYEVPGGHREPGETIEETAARELEEETGAVDYRIKPVCVYSVTGKNRVNASGEETFGKLFFAEVASFGRELQNEISEIACFDTLPEKPTYPLIQPYLISKAEEFLKGE
ncbi:MAG: NUDIX domain-containing protein [Massilimaliae sp.]|nr:NUDIX domain-containing protein [Massiliimalia sp.]